MVSAPRAAKALADSLLVSRVTALTWNWLAAFGSASKDFTTEPPCLPVAPITTMIRLEGVVWAIALFFIREKRLKTISDVEVGRLESRRGEEVLGKAVGF